MTKYENNRCDGNEHRANRIAVVSSLVIFVLALTAGSARSFDTRQDSLPKRSVYQHKVSSSAAKEACRPLLQASNYEGPNSIAAVSRPEAGKVKALVIGMVAGAQFALSPAGPASQRLDDKTKNAGTHYFSPGNPQALAVASYRKCVKQKILKERTGSTQDL
jgi:hypothetical protein